MRHLVGSAMVLALLSPGAGVVPAAAESAVQATFYVSPSGSDTGSGSQASPFRTLERARDAVRAVNTASSPMTGDIVVKVAPGDYHVTSPVTFDNRDSGTNGHRVIYTRADGAALGSARFIGGTKVASAWQQVVRTGADADLPASAATKVFKTQVGTAVNFNTLYVNDTRATLARTQNKVVDPRFAAADTQWLYAAGGGMGSLSYAAGALDAASEAGLVNAQARGDLDAQVHAWSYGKDWMTDTIPIGSVNASTRTLGFRAVSGHPELNRPHFPVAGGSRFYVQGNLGFLDAPGEYYFNKTTGYLYYYPRAGEETLANQSVVIPAVEKVVDIKGTSRTAMVSSITFDGLAFMDTNFPDYYTYGWNYADNPGGMGTYPPEATGSTLPSYSETTERREFHVGVITLENTSDITITNARVKNAGMFGIELYLANQGIRISNSVVEHTGHGGINIDGGYPGKGGDNAGNGYSRDNVVDNCIVHDVGQLVGQTAGVSISNSMANTVSHSEIYNSPRRGLLLIGGWRRNMNASAPMNDTAFDFMKHLYAHHNVFSHNYIHHAQQDGGDDGGIFGVFLYQGATNYRVNTIDQVLVDAVGANPSMRDFAPNGMNLDMGNSGFEVKNFKSVNPQNFNTEVNTILQYGDKITFTNTNVDYGTLTNQIADFDDSLIDYANIGVDDSFPAVYRPAGPPVSPEPSNVYFKDAFEGGLDLTKWTYRGNKPLISTQFMSEGVFGGKRALMLDNDLVTSGSEPVLYRDFGTNLNKVVTVKLFDRQSSHLAIYDSGAGTRPSTSRSIARADDGSAAVGLGVDSTLSSGYYVMQHGATVTPTAVPRTYGWHELKWDYTSGTDVKLYIDGVLVRTLTAPPTLRRIELGSDNGVGVNLYDQVYVSGGSTSGTAAALTPPPPNYAESATVTASSQYSGAYSARNAIDTITGVTGRGEWASASQLTPWLNLAWPTGVTVNTVVLHDRPNSADQVTAGRLVFSDGSEVPVPALPNNGAPYTVSFPDKTTTSVRFEVTSGQGGAVGLSELEVRNQPPAPIPNIAPSASVTVSSQYSSQYAGAKAVDGIVGQHGTGEWAVANGDTAPSIQLTWPTSQTTNRVVLHDRPNSIDRVTGGTLTFSDGSRVPVPALPNDGTGQTITFPDKTVDWVRFDATTYTGLPGLSELQVYAPYPNLSKVATITSSSQYSTAYTPSRVADDVVGMTGTGEWAAANSDAAPWVNLSWGTTPTSLSEVVLHDRANSTDRVLTGTLTFSDGSSVAVGALPNDGSAQVVSFPARTVTWVRFQANTFTGLPGLAELRTRFVPATNLAAAAAPSASTEYSSQYSAARITDGITGLQGSGEWAKAGGDSSPWARLDWAHPVSLSHVTLYDRSNSLDRVTGGRLVFSDGSTVSVPALANDGTATSVAFPTRSASWVRFEITSSTGLPGLAEFQAFS